jgi:hypothetical protein
MKIFRELDLNRFEPWAGAVSTYERIAEEGKLDDLKRLLEECYPDGIEETEINDLLWFEEDWLYEWLGISDEE